MTGFFPTFFALTLCLIFSFLLSGMEAGVFALNRLRIRRLARNGKRSAQILNGFLEKPEKPKKAPRKKRPTKGGLDPA